MEWQGYAYEDVDPSELSARALRDAATRHPEFDWRAGRAWVTLARPHRAPVRAEVLYRPETGRAGVAWGAGGVRWTNSSGTEDALRCCLTMIRTSQS